MPAFSDGLKTKVEFIKGVGPQRAAMLNTELGIFTIGDLISYFPFRHEDRSKLIQIREIREDLSTIQVKGTLRSVQQIGEGHKARLQGQIDDGSGWLDLVWFQGIKWVRPGLAIGAEYIVYGKPNLYGRNWSIAHPELELFSAENTNKGWVPVYSVTEKLKAKSLDSKGISKLLRLLFPDIKRYIPETLPENLLQELKLIPRAQAFEDIHFPQHTAALDKARFRLKFEELFLIQMQLLRTKDLRQKVNKGLVLSKIDKLTLFYKNHLPYSLTEAQKRVIKEIRSDVLSGKQMNRLLQGDVGSGKTIVAFLTMLMAPDNEAQACLMAPTEILSNQHYQGLKPFADAVGLNIAILTSSTKTAERKKILEDLESGALSFIIGTHALLEDRVKFKQLGICIIDEQHRFGVAQRARLWAKNEGAPPHILVMTATPIPRTLAMTLYGDLDVSIIDELPAGRKPIQTVHRRDSERIKVFGFMRKEIEAGRQVYVVYPLIEESANSDLKDLMDGYESMSRAFPEVPLGIVYGRMKPADKDYEMARFSKGETKILVATTVIEVGVNVPNATLMVIENANRFGLAQLHQLRGRVGRGSEQSYCILMTDNKLGADSRHRIEVMVQTNNGFEIADADLMLRGPGELAGTQQSGVLELKLADLAQDAQLLQIARDKARAIIEEDPNLSLPKHNTLHTHLNEILKHKGSQWAQIS